MSLDSMEEMLMKIGPTGGLEGNCWEEGGLGMVSSLCIFHSIDRINSIQVAYKENPSDGNVIFSARHGGSDGDYFDAIQLSGDESIVCVSGYYGDVRWSSSVIRSLSFTIKNAVSGECKTFGPFGNEGGTHFSFRMDCGMFGGFHGYSDYNYLRAIGVYVRPHVKTNNALKRNFELKKRDDAHIAYTSTTLDLLIQILNDLRKSLPHKSTPHITEPSVDEDDC